MDVDNDETNLEERKSTSFYFHPCNDLNLINYQNPGRRLKGGKLYPIAYFTRVNAYTLYIILIYRIDKMFHIPKYKRKRVAYGQETQ